ncbi:MAG: hypothetical protein IJT72_08850 [Lachnospiraceae bacterium]|nr:hypothetical protein [Lachnospiraceae bacterium]
MAKNCNQNQRTINNETVNNKGACCGATDVCLNPQCGDPRLLSLLAPVIYDEVGINVCQTITLPEGFLTDYPTAYYATAEVIDISLETAATEATSVTPIATRPNCYNVTLTNLTVNFAIKLYDYGRRLLATLSLPGIVYLPSDVTDPGYDSETNPTSTSFDIFAPYGISYVGGDITTPELNIIGFADTNNTVAQGLNVMALPKVLDFDPTSEDITIGLTIICNSLYFNAYRIPHDGKAIATKGSLVTDDDSIRMEFVEGSLLDRNIKPLELCNPCDTKNPNLNDDINNCGGSN